MRALILTLMFLLGVAAPPAALAQTPPDAVSLVVYPGHRYFTIEDGGDAVFADGRNDAFTFRATHEDYVRIRDLLGPYRAGGLRCNHPEPDTESSGYFSWREDGVETRRPAFWFCGTAAHDEALIASEQAWDAMREIAFARQPPLPFPPDPALMTLTWLYWGNPMETWTLPRGGQAAWTDRNGVTKTFDLSVADFDRVRDIFRPYEGKRFECERAVTDQPYGRLVWSQPGHDDQELRWDMGCVTGDAADVFTRVQNAETFLTALRDGG